MSPLAKTRGRILIVEDELLVAMIAEEFLIERGWEIAATVGWLDEALALAGSIAIDAALIDVNLNGRASFPIAEVLEERGVAMVFATGYGAAGVPERWRGRPILQKPFQGDQLQRALDLAANV